jgi:CxxC motif-containing protein (DUF1111 family)
MVIALMTAGGWGTVGSAVESVGAISAAETEILIGRSFFRSPWVVAPSSTSARDGLGPLYNARACDSCHPSGGRGGAPGDKGQVEPALLLRLSTAGQDARGAPLPDPHYGHQLQPLASFPAAPGASVISAGAFAGEGRLRVRYHDLVGHYGDGTPYRLRQPEYSVEGLRHGPVGSKTRLSPRLAPALGGVGLLETVPESEILAHADPDDRDGDSISGRANWVWDRGFGRQRLGRFGHKASQPSLAQQVAAAFRDDMGLTSTLYPLPDCAAIQSRCRREANGSDPSEGVEVTRSVLAAVTVFVQAQPVRRGKTATASTREGKNSFQAFGCAACHLPTLRTGARTNWPQLADRSIVAYTDLLLHDLGPALGDGRPEFHADGNEWRTAPLWGLSADPRDRQTRGYLHDGRARTLAEAILWHAGEAANAREAFRRAPPADRQALLRFLSAL